MDNLLYIKEIAPMMSGKQYAPIVVLPGIPLIVMNE